MGAATIVTNKGDGQYSVTLKKDTSRIAAAIQRCQDGISAAAEAITGAEQAKADAQQQVIDAGKVLDAAVIAAKGDTSSAAATTAQDALWRAGEVLEIAQHTLAQVKLKKAAYEKELATYPDISASEQRDVWCADATDDIQPGKDVGTIEVNQEAKQILIMPGGKAGEGTLQPGMANDALATYLNWSILPGVQRWRPTYRVGKILAVNYDLNTCTVCMDAAKSSAQNIEINPTVGEKCESDQDAPPGLVDFCKINPNHPACTEHDDTTLEMTLTLRELLASVNKGVNDKYTYEYDSEQYGRLENWVEMPEEGGSGDCEDFALTKMRALINAGVPAGAIKLATGKTSSGDGHAWLEVQTSEGSIALDLNFRDPQDVGSLPYSDRVVQRNGLEWGSVGIKYLNVPASYMDCNAEAFAADDRVIIHLENNNWNTPKVIGFVEEPEYCGDIACIYTKDDKVLFSRITMNNTTKKLSVSKGKNSDSVMGLNQQFINEYFAGEHFRTFSGRIKVGSKYLYVFASPFGSDYIYINTIHDPPYSNGYTEGDYYSVYNPETKKGYRVPVYSSGICARDSFFNFSDTHFYTISANFTNSVVSSYTLKSVAFSLDTNGVVVFEEPEEYTITSSTLLAHGYWIGDITSLVLDYIKSDGTYYFSRVAMYTLGYVDTLTQWGHVQVNIHTKTFDTLASNTTGASEYFDTSRIVRKYAGVGVDAGTVANTTQNGTNNLTIGSYSITNPRTDLNPNNTGGGFVDVRLHYKYVKMLDHDSNTNIHSGFHLVGYYNHAVFSQPGAPAGTYWWSKTLITPYEVLNDVDINVCALSKIIRANGDCLQAMATQWSDGIFTGEVDNVIVYYNGTRIDSDLASALGIEAKDIVGFIHTPRR